jgi:hypothetical protein
MLHASAERPAALLAGTKLGHERVFVVAPGDLIRIKRSRHYKVVAVISRVR